MALWKKILCPVDLSDVSKQALRYAGRICRETDAHLLVLYVLEPMANPGNLTFRPVTITDLEEQLVEHARNTVEGLVGEMGLGPDAVTTGVQKGVASVEIVRAAEEEGVDLIVMGTHGLTGISHVLLGSTAERVVRKAPCPVLTIKRSGET